MLIKSPRHTRIIEIDITMDIRYGLSRYSIHPEISMDVTAVAGIYVGRKKPLGEILKKRSITER